MIYKKPVMTLSKRAYGGDLIGDGSSYYDRVTFSPIDPDKNTPQLLRNKRKYNEAVKSLQSFAQDIRDSKNVFSIFGKPVNYIVLSKQKWNQGNNIGGKQWADKVDAAIAQRDIDAIHDLASYNYAWYGTKGARNLDPRLRLRVDSKGRFIQGTKGGDQSMSGKLQRSDIFALLGVAGLIAASAAIACALK